MQKFKKFIYYICMAKYNIRTLEEKEAIWAFYQKHGFKKMYEKYGVSRSLMSVWRERIETADASNKHPLARRYLVGPSKIAYVKQMRKENPSLSLEQLRQKILPKFKISKTSIWHILTGR